MLSACLAKRSKKPSSRGMNRCKSPDMLCDSPLRSLDQAEAVYRRKKGEARKAGDLIAAIFCFQGVSGSRYVTVADGGSRRIQRDRSQTDMRGEGETTWDPTKPAPSEGPRRIARAMTMSHRAAA